MTSTELFALGLAQTREALLHGDVSALDCATATVHRAKDLGFLNAIVTRDDQSLLVHAKRQDAAGTPRNPWFRLAGIPVLLSDSINTVALPTAAGTVALKGRVPPTDAACASRLFATGALLAGKANMHELALGVTGNNAATGPTHNPWKTNCIPGGGSGGAAAAVAARIVSAAIGIDASGSVRMSAALCGVVGFRPSTGRYSREGLMTISHTRDTPGPIARSVDDIALLDSVLGGDETPLANINLAGLRLGVPRAYFYDGAEDNVLAVVESVLETLSRAGVTFLDVEIGELRALNEAVGSAISLYEMTQDLSAYLLLCGHGLSLAELAAAVASPDVARILGAQLARPTVSLDAYKAALRTRSQLQWAYSTCFSAHRLDAMVFPTARLTARPIGDDVSVTLRNAHTPTCAAYVHNTDPGCNGGVPGISLPVGLAWDGLPVGMEIDGPVHSDRRLIAIARAIERVLPPMPCPSIAMTF